jgi:hypothetical protein
VLEQPLLDGVLELRSEMSIMLGSFAQTA